MTIVQFFAISSIITAVLSALLGGFSYTRNRYSLLNKLWLYVSISITLWSIGLGLEVIAPSESIALFWNKILNLGAIFIPIFYYHFVTVLLEVASKRRVSLSIGYGLSIVFVFFNFFGSLFVKGVPPAAGFNYWVDPGPVYYVFFAVFVFYILYSFISMLIVSRKLSAIKRTQVRYVLLAGIIGFGGGLTDFFPQLINAYPFGNFFVTFYVFVITFAIVKYRLMNIKFIITKSILYFLLVSVVTTVFAFTTFFIGELLQVSGRLSEILILMVVSFVIVVGIDPLKRLLAKVTDDIFYKDKIDYQQVLRKMGVTIAKEIDLEVFLSALRHGLKTDLKVKAADVLVLRQDKYKSMQKTALKSFVKEGPLVKHLIDDQQIIITDELYRKIADQPTGDQREHDQLVLDELEREGVEFCVPVLLEGELKAIIIMSEKQSGDIYGTEDIEFFRILSPQIAVAIEKSQLYEEIGEFNLKLQEKINKATQELKSTNLELQDANKHLKQLDKAKSEFLSIASHQLRTPISAVKGYLSMLLEGDFGDVPDNQRKIISDVFESSSRLARLINIFLNVSRIESGRFKLDKKTTDVDELVESVLKELDGQAKSKNLTLSFSAGKNNVPIYIDADKIREVILNLIDNAIKYTQEGNIDMQTYIKDKQFHFLISDKGLGIRQEEVKSLFRKFVRGTGIAQVNTQGSGLGLYIAQRVVAEHDGKIWAESEGLHKGSTFHFYVPIVKEPAKTEEEETN